MAWCEANSVDYVFGLARNERLWAEIEEAMTQTAEQYHKSGKAAWVFCAFRYQTHQSWSRPWRVVAKAEQLTGKENPRYLVTSLSADDGRPSGCMKSSTACAVRWRTASMSS